MTFARSILAGYEQDLRTAADIYGLKDLMDSLTTAHAKWASDGRPIAAPLEPRKYIEIDGLRIVK